MDALGLFSSGLSGYSIIWAGGGTLNESSLTAANGSFLVVSSLYSYFNNDITFCMQGFMIISNGSTAYCGGFCYSKMDDIMSFDSVGVKYSGSTISRLNGTIHFSGFIIA